MSKPLAVSEPSLSDPVDEAVEFLRTNCPRRPRFAIILGSGLGGLADDISSATTIPYEKIPHFPQTTALGHKGCLVFGELEGVACVAMQGRFHLYEGHSPQRIALPIQVLKALGVETLIVSNASGGLNPHYAAAEIMIVEDHLNLMFRNPLIGPNDDRRGPRFPDMCFPYDREWIRIAEEVARREDIRIHLGVYAALTGPSYETRAEYRFLRKAGADVVGMSTVPETIAAVHAGLRVLGLSVVTNVCRPDRLAPTSGAEVVETAGRAESNMRRLVRGIMRGNR